MDPTQYGYPGYNFIMGGMGGQQMGAGQLPLGGSPLMGQSFMQPQQFGQQTPAPQGQQGHGGGMSPLMMLSPLMSMFMSGHRNLGLGMISPALGIASALGAFK